MFQFFWLNFLVKGGFFSFTKQDNSSDLEERNDESSEFSFLFCCYFSYKIFQLRGIFCLNNLYPVDRFILFSCQPQENLVIPCGMDFFPLNTHKYCLLNLSFYYLKHVKDQVLLPYS